MKRIVATVGLAALGAASVQSANAESALGGDGAKAWTISTSLRGFYDDNINTTQTKQGSFGFEVSPTLTFEMSPTDQTDLSFAYTLGYKYYDKGITVGTNKTDNSSMTHTVAANLRHSFSERTAFTFSDSFVIGQEPDLLQRDFYGTFQYLSGDNIRNYVSAIVNHQLTREVGLELGYANSFYDYDDNQFILLSDDGSGTTSGVPNNPLTVFRASNSGLLDRSEHTIHLDARWTLQPTTVVLAGYQFDFADYTANQPIGVITNSASPTNTVLYSDSRNSYSHYGYVGAEHTFRPDLTGSLRAGARYTDNYNSPDKSTSVGPYAMGSLRYRYTKDSHVEAGVSHDLHATDLFSTRGPAGNRTTQNADSTVFFATVTHQIFPDLTGTLGGQFQYSTYNGGEYDNKSDRFYSINAGLDYHINRHIAASVSYSYDKLESDVPARGYDRNRVFLGTTVTY